MTLSQVSASGSGVAEVAPLETTEDWHEAIRSASKQKLGEHGRLRDITSLGGNARSFSSVKRFSLSFERSEIDACLKVHRRADKGFEEECVRWAWEEFMVLKTIHGVTDADGYPSVVRPILFLPALPGILLETNHGQILNEKLRARSLGRGLVQGAGALEELCEIYFDTGRNLKSVHGLGQDGRPRREFESFGPYTFDAEFILGEADRRVEKLELYLSGRQLADIQSEYRRLREHFVSCARGAFPLVPSHGDFTPVNIFVTGGRVTFFDFVNFHFGHPYEDVSRFLSYTLFLQKDPSAFGSRAIGRLTRSFVEGYDLDHWREDPVLAFFLHKNILRTLTGGLRFQNKPWPLNTLYRRGMLRVFRRWVEGGMALPRA